MQDAAESSDCQQCTLFMLRERGAKDASMPIDSICRTNITRCPRQANILQQQLLILAHVRAGYGKMIDFFPTERSYYRQL